MIKKKICILGSFAVGKTSLINQFVSQSFSENYHTTIGVKIDQKNLVINDNEMNLLIWDIHGEDRFQHVQASYLIGASGYFLVVDATRRESLSVLSQLKTLVEKTSGNIPYKLLINKTDLKDQIEITAEDFIEYDIQSSNIVYTSAKTGEGVNEAFTDLAKLMIPKT